ncbi:MAG TPA: DUF2207 domain-containing protein [Candidatus Paceibacterota bacterium]|nr:DUF2207 domain-containing protein [Candidatus Paceibacterota bacterium]
MLKNKIISTGAVFWSTLLFVFPIFVHAAEFPNYAVQAILGRDGLLGVEEHFTFDFGVDGNHGVIREIPLLSGGKSGAPITFHMLSVANKAGLPYKFDASSGGNVALVRIGDKDVILKGPHYYDFRYTLNGLATNTGLRWQITTPVKEVMKKFQADIYFSIPVPPVTATGTCSFTPGRTSGGCLLKPLIKDDKLYGFRLNIDNLTKDGVVVEISYPRGLVELPAVTTRDTPRALPQYMWYILATLVFTVLLAALLWKNRKYIADWRAERKKPVLFPDAYSYLTRAVAGHGYISKKDIIAAITDLTARGYLTLSPIPHPVGEYEFIDYALQVPVLELPAGAEGALLSVIMESSGIASLDDWLTKDFAQHRENIEEAARSEIEGIVLLRSDEPLPDLPGFKSERYEE